MKIYRLVQKLLETHTHIARDWWFDKPTLIFGKSAKNKLYFPHLQHSPALIPKMIFWKYFHEQEFLCAEVLRDFDFSTKSVLMFYRLYFHSMLQLMLPGKTKFMWEFKIQWALCEKGK
jgi:hypothetical protein